MSKELIISELNNLGSHSLDLLRKHRVIKPLIESLLLEKECSRAKSLEKQVIDSAMNQHFKNIKVTTEEKLSSYLNSVGLSKEELIFNVTRPIILTHVALEKYSVIAEEIFIKKKQEFDTYKYNILFNESNELLIEFFFRLENNEKSFLDLMNELPYAEESNLLNINLFHSRREMHPLIFEKIEKAKNGSIIEPFKVGDNWVLIQLLKKNVATFDNKAKERICFEIMMDEISKISGEIFSDIFRF